MSFLLPLVLLLIFIACVAFLYTEGMWSNAIRLINVVTAALLATNFWEPVATRLDRWQPSYTYMWDFVVLWGLFAALVMVFRSVTDFLSKLNVRFLKLADRIGSVVLACWIGWVMVCFATFTLHTAPLARNFLGGGFQPEKRMLLGMAPDRQWLGFVQRMSQGTYCRSATPEQWEKEVTVFDPRAEFLPKYATRRTRLEDHVKHNNTLRIRN